ncbi:MAG: helix-hairpin-helix domain-containing protein, partial [Rhodobacteraceae bacterium]|nr:helix-hairpin-helix domain-containing protein [Paracoccaceae bacterium]
MSELMKIPGVGLALATRLRELGIHSLEDLAKSDVSVLMTVRGISESKAQDFKSAASGDLTEPSKSPTTKANNILIHRGCDIIDSNNSTFFVSHVLTIPSSNRIVMPATINEQSITTVRSNFK